MSNEDSDNLFRKMLRSWFELTVNEQRTILLITAILLIGLCARVWHGAH